MTIEPGELWSDSTYDVTEFRQVVVPLPLIPNFRLSFTKFPSVLNNNGIQRYPFSVCIRNVKIVPGELNPIDLGPHKPNFIDLYSGTTAFIF